jgi:hypothetical protein
VHDGEGSARENTIKEEPEWNVNYLKSVYIRNTCFKISNNEIFEEEMLPQ